MTRFARSKGSKASNERVPETATPWAVMKTQLVEKNKEIDEAKQREQINAQRLRNYETFLSEQNDIDCNAPSEWAEFPGMLLDAAPAVTQKKEQDVERLSPSGSDDDAPPDECSSKIVPTTTGNDDKKLIKKRTKNKKKKLLKIVADSIVATKNNKEQEKKEESQISNTTMVVKKAVVVAEEDLIKIERKNRKKQKQLEKRRLKRQLKSAAATDEVVATPATTPLKPATTKKPRDNNNDSKPVRKKAKQQEIVVDGKPIELDYVDGFPIKKDDALRLKKLRSDMISRSLPRSAINQALKAERRRAERVLAREKKLVCFNCRQSGHLLSDCPQVGRNVGEQSLTVASGICYKCGSTEHTINECKLVRGDNFKFATCFICNEQGHISRQCPDNGRGLYPNGGACNLCGDVTHLRKDCMKGKQQQNDQFYLETISGSNPDNLEEEGSRGSNSNKIVAPFYKPNKVIKFT